MTRRRGYRETPRRGETVYRVTLAHVNREGLDYTRVSYRIPARTGAGALATALKRFTRCFPAGYQVRSVAVDNHPYFDTRGTR